MKYFDGKTLGERYAFLDSVLGKPENQVERSKQLVALIAIDCGLPTTGLAAKEEKALRAALAALEESHV